MLSSCFVYLYSPTIIWCFVLRWNVPRSYVFLCVWSTAFRKHSKILKGLRQFKVIALPARDSFLHPVTWEPSDTHCVFPWYSVASLHALAHLDFCVKALNCLHCRFTVYQKPDRFFRETGCLFGYIGNTHSLCLKYRAVVLVLLV